MDSQTQSTFRSLTPITTCASPTITASDATSPAVDSCAAVSKTPEGRTRHDARSLASILHQRQVSEYNIQYFQSGNYKFSKVSPGRNRASSRVTAHDEAMESLVDDLSIGSALDYNDPDRDVGEMVKEYDNEDKRTHFSVHDAEKPSGSSLVFSATISIVSETVAHHMAKEVVGKFSSGAEEAARVLKRLRRRDYEQL